MTIWIGFAQAPIVTGRYVSSQTCNQFFDSKANRKCIFNAGMKPNIKENPRNRKKTKRGRKRFFDEALYWVRFTIERAFAWEDKFKRVVLRYETKQKRHLGFKLIAFTLINLREFCEG